MRDQKRFEFMESISVEEMKRIEEKAYSTGTRSYDLMERAGKQCALIIREMGYLGKNILVFCGPGNNGGDGLVCARELSKDNTIIAVLPLPLKTEISRRNLELLERSGVRIAGLDIAKSMVTASWADLIVDALLGMGAKGEPRPPLDSTCELINSSNAKIVSIDVPTGMDADDGSISGVYILPDVTISIHAHKNGVLASEDKAGRLALADIGLSD